MNRIIIPCEDMDNPNNELSIFRKCIEKVLDIKNIRGITLREIIYEQIPEFNQYKIFLDTKGNIVMNELLFRLVEHGTMEIPRYQIISKAILKFEGGQDGRFIRNNPGLFRSPRGTYSKSF